MTHVLTVNQLDVTLSEQAILKQVSCALKLGEILGLVGPSGCGKTTLLNTIAGFIAQQSGDIVIADKPAINAANLLPPEQRQVGMIFQDYALFPHLTVEQNIAFGISKMPKAEQQQRVTQLLSLLALDGFAKRYPHELSGGQQQRVAIARAIAPQPKLLLLDEPFSNIDARLRHSLMLELRQLFKSLEMTAIFVTHNKDEVFTFADKMAVMANGEILQFGSPADICQAPNSYQVADFLQLGSWLPCQVSGGKLTTVIGEFSLPESFTYADGSYQLLVKPQYIEVTRTKGEAGTNTMAVAHIGVTENGFHYHLTSADSSSPLSIGQLSVYGNDVFSLAEKLQVVIKPHDYLVFPT